MRNVWMWLGMLTLVSCVTMPSASWGAPDVPRSREQLQLTFAPVAQATMPSVVNIYSRRILKQRPSQSISPLDDPFFHFFFAEDTYRAIPRERIERSLGSGVVVDAKGIIITNNHVIKGADQITVVLADRREFEATVRGTDERTDLAVLQIELGEELLPALEMGNSDDLEVGELVLAIGNPFGMGQTVTNGIISALARSNVGIGDFRSFIQTDAAINPGNSGGALVTMDGRLIGINTAIYSRGGGSIGIGFATPSNLVKVVLDALTKDGRVVRPWLGATGDGVNFEMSQALKLARPYGVLINDVIPDSPADMAGLKEGDLLLAVDGHMVEDAAAMRFRLALLPLGGKAHFLVMRNGEAQMLVIDLIAPPEMPPRDETEIEENHPFGGAVIANLNPALAQERGIFMQEEGGVIVLDVPAGSPAARIGLEEMDMIRSINGHPIRKVSDLKKVDVTARRWSITIERDGETINATVIR